MNFPEKGELAICSWNTTLSFQSLNFHNYGNTLSLRTRPTRSSRKLCVNQSKSSKTFIFIGGLTSWCQLLCCDSGWRVCRYYLSTMSGLSREQPSVKRLLFCSLWRHLYSPDFVLHLLFYCWLFPSCWRPARQQTAQMCPGQNTKFLPDVVFRFSTAWYHIRMLSRLLTK